MSSPVVASILTSVRAGAQGRGRASDEGEPHNRSPTSFLVHHRVAVSSRVQPIIAGAVAAALVGVACVT
ncbi:MAG TPA: hypothetical protein VK698_11290, partial [Kofleriaceae bacterium]|nr:hypothetical protein [Kofleriaceae bacterium]